MTSIGKNNSSTWLITSVEKKAIVAIARKLLVIIWHVLTAKVADRRAEPQQVARYFITWGRQLRVKTTLGLKASEFARQHLDRLQLGRNWSACLTARSPTACRLPRLIRPEMVSR
ncbi:MAG: hypothetical protein HS126_39845 [Anaerolineales bacterium]|nr:hypothetical protein [Anaerolineales bacterium]